MSRIDITGIQLIQIQMEYNTKNVVIKKLSIAIFETVYLTNISNDSKVNAKKNSF